MNWEHVTTLASVIVAGLAVIATWRAPIRARADARADRRADKQWSVCVGLIEVAFRGLGELTVAVAVIEQGGRFESFDVGEPEYLHHLAAAQLVSRSVGVAFRAFTDAWNAMAADLPPDGQAATPAEVLPILSKHAPPIRGAVDALIAEATRTIGSA